MPESADFHFLFQIKPSNLSSATLLENINKIGTPRTFDAIYAGGIDGDLHHQSERAVHYSQIKICSLPLADVYLLKQQEQLLEQKEAETTAGIHYSLFFFCLVFVAGIFSFNIFILRHIYNYHFRIRRVHSDIIRDLPGSLSLYEGGDSGELSLMDKKTKN